jgi:hypothetical protein
VILRSGVLGIFIIRKLTAKSKKHLYGAAHANSRARDENEINGDVERDPPRLITPDALTRVRPLPSHQSNSINLVAAIDAVAASDIKLFRPSLYLD